LDGIYLPIQLTNWLLVEVALLLIGLAQISLQKFVLTFKEEISRLLDYQLRIFIRE
jgi:hypothetical protein